MTMQQQRFIRVKPMNTARGNLYQHVTGAMRALAQCDEGSYVHFRMRQDILSLNDINDVLTMSYQSPAHLVEYAPLFTRAWRLVATPEVHRLIRHECTLPGRAPIVVVGDPFASDDAVAAPSRKFRTDAFPEEPGPELLLNLVTGALKVPGYPAPRAAGAPLLPGTHIRRLAWESGVVVIEWVSAEAFLAYGDIPMYALRVTALHDVPVGTVRHLLPDGTRVEANVHQCNPRKRVYDGIRQDARAS